ncbi:MAG: chemotaxis protein CheW [Thermodesulfobacteriota bacterium]|nr:chemotaxis protein CheW [Thermodesulfobacteriota bacterium]
MSDTTDVMSQAVQAAADKEGKYLTFQLADEEYGIGIMKIKEIIGMMPITSVPRTPDFIKGVVNLRGKVIPVTDLRLKLGMDEVEVTDRTCIIVTEIRGKTSSIQMGIIVDAVSEVLNVKAEEVEDTPEFGTTIDTAYILGIAKMDDGGVKILLDIDRILSPEELQQIEQVEKSEQAA